MSARVGLVQDSPEAEPAAAAAQQPGLNLIRFMSLNPLILEQRVEAVEMLQDGDNRLDYINFLVGVISSARG